MKSWPLGLKIGLGVAVVLAIVLLLRPWRSSQEGTAPLANAPTGTRREPKVDDRVRQRIEQLRGTRDAAGHLSVSRGVTATPGPKMQGTGAGQRAVTAPNPQELEEEPAALIDDPDDIPTLLHLALEDPDPERRLAAVALLGASEDPQVIPVLGQALSDENEEVRMAALESLSDFTDEPPVEAIENALNDSAADIRFEALSILADIGGERARNAIAKAMNDPDEEVRNLAEGILDLETVYNETPAVPEVSATPQPNG